MGSIEAVQALKTQIETYKGISDYELGRYCQRTVALLGSIFDDDDDESFEEYLSQVEGIESQISARANSVTQGYLVELLQSVINELQFRAALNQARPTAPSVAPTAAGHNPFLGPSSVPGSVIPRGYQPPPAASLPTISNRVFIVHGRDEAMKQTVARVLERIKLDPIILHEQSNAGRTIIEKFLDYSDVGCAVVLLTPDDMGVAVGDPTANARYRARQNVIFELGFFIGKIGRDRVFALYPPTQNFEFPSDFSGVIYIEYDRPDGAWRGQIAKELKRLGYDIDMNRLY